MHLLRVKHCTWHFNRAVLECESPSEPLGGPQMAWAPLPELHTQEGGAEA